MVLFVLLLKGTKAVQHLSSSAFLGERTVTREHPKLSSKASRGRA